MESKNKTVGRPQVIKPTIVSKLEQAFSFDATAEEACSYAGISRATYYRKVNSDELFRDKMERAQMLPFIKAKKTVMQAMFGGDGKLAFKWLERRQKDRYSFNIKAEITTFSYSQLENSIASSVEEAKLLATQEEWDI